jgi:hypothetical protein
MDATLSVYKTDGPHCHLELAGDITRAMHRRCQDHRRHRYRQHRRRSLPGGRRRTGKAGEVRRLHAAGGHHRRHRQCRASLGKQTEFGTLEAGKYANMVFLQRDPLQDIGNLRNVVMTVKRGHEFARSDYKFTPLPVHDD